MRRWFTAIVCVLGSAVAGAVQAACAEDRVDVRGDWGQARFSVEVADTPEETATGLMNRETMPRSAGMLFVYPDPRQVHFWMKNTLIPLDMIFMTEDGRVSRIHENAVPLDETLIYGGDKVKFVLEINGGLASLFGIDVGSELRHPLVDAAKAAWPCE